MSYLNGEYQVSIHITNWHPIDSSLGTYGMACNRSYSNRDGRLLWAPGAHPYIMLGPSLDIISYSKSSQILNDLSSDVPLLKNVSDVLKQIPNSYCISLVIAFE